MSLSGNIQLWLAVAGLALFIVLESFVRALRLVDYPLHVANAVTGYEMRPNSHGLMRRKFRWRYNASGLRLDHDDPPGPGSVLLIGDSIVDGGPYVDQDSTLPALVAALSRRQVVPLACGGWSLENELAFLRSRPEFWHANTLLLVVNSSDLTGLNRWRSHCTHPAGRPHVHSLFLIWRATWLLRYRIAQKLFGPDEEASSEAWRNSVSLLLRQAGDKRLIWVLYPSLDEVENNIAPAGALRPVIGEKAEILEVLSLPQWNAQCYDDGLHPGAMGRHVLAEAISATLLNQQAQARLQSAQV